LRYRTIASQGSKPDLVSGATHLFGHKIGKMDAFVEVDGGADGIGKIIDFDEETAEVEYFESPAGPSLRAVRVPVERIRGVELSAQTRVFWLDPARSAWYAGRVDGGLVSAAAINAKEDHYHISFPNKQDARIPVSQLYVRWSHPVEDPTHYLAAKVTDTPFFSDGRSRFVRHIMEQRAAFGGLTALASSAVELLEHQVAIVRRILADPIERYLLADEVGLGKTIEAGILIRQHVIDLPDTARVLVIVPGHLVSQWEDELESKMFLGPEDGVDVVPETALLDSRLTTANPTLLVVDEAHRPALRAFSSDTGERRAYNQLRLLAARVPRLLLLSGTPVLHQEDGFLAMLHLIDPDAYPLHDLDSFRRRVEERQSVAEAIADLADDASSFFAEDAIARLEHAFQSDLRLKELCSITRLHLHESLDSASRIASLSSLRSHVAEAYRLDRRILRTRRGDPRVEMYLPKRKGLVTIEHEDQGRLEAFDFLDAWRSSVDYGEVGDRDKENLFAALVASALSHPLVLLRHLDARLALRRGERVSSLPEDRRKVFGIEWAFEGEREFLEQRRRLIAEALDLEDRAVRLAEWFRANADVRKAIVFVDDTKVANRVQETLKELLDSEFVLRYLGDSESVRIFEKSSKLSILVCDGSVEEGLNLQRCGAATVHYDLPLEPARVEQRIGRVDRIEGRGQIRNVAFTGNYPYESEWLECLNQAIRVFDRSVAPLQYVLAEATNRIRAVLLPEGKGAIEQEAARLSDRTTGLDSELRRIRAQESIDAIEGGQAQDSDFFEALVENDELVSTEGERAVNSWLVERLQFARHVLEPGITRYAYDPRRPTLLPALQVATRFIGCIDKDALRISRQGFPFLPVTFDRVIAEKSRVGLLRVGHPLMQGIETLIRSDDRGMAFAMWRYVPRSLKIPRLFFRFDFAVEVDLAHAFETGAAQITSKEALRRRADEAFPVSHRTIWLTSDLDEVKIPAFLKILEMPYSKHLRTNGGFDLNLRPELWDGASTAISLGDWPSLCANARGKAERTMRSDPAFQKQLSASAERVRHTAAAVSVALSSRIARLSGPSRKSEERVADLEAYLSRSLEQGIEEPSIRVDSAGAVILASTPLGGE
jgi:ATP-dependent helicase HepA